MLRDSVVVVVVVGRKCPRAILLAMITMRKSTHGVSFCFPYMGCLWSSAWRPFRPPKLRYNCLGLTDEDNSVSRTDNFVNVNVFNTVTSARVLSYRWVLHYFSTIPVGGIKIVTIYKRSIFHVEWLIATLILCISHCSESDSVSSRVFYSAVSTAPRFLFNYGV